MADTVASAMTAASAALRREHDVQLRLLEAIEKAAAHRRPDHELAELVDQLVDYTNVHFLSEQLLMRMYAYPAYAEHEDHHNELLDGIRELEARLAAGDEEQLQRAARNLQEWVNGHIGRDDAMFARYLEEGGAASTGC